MKIAIVGSGISGLVAAHRLQAGHQGGDAIADELCILKDVGAEQDGRTAGTLVQNVKFAKNPCPG